MDLDNILGQLRSPPVLTSDARDQLIFTLGDINLYAKKAQRGHESYGARSEVDKQLGSLLKHIQSLRHRIKPENLTALYDPLLISLFELSKSAEGSIESLLHDVRTSLSELGSVVDNLCKLVDEFDKLESEEQLRWGIRLTLPGARDARELLSPYLRDGRGIRPDTYVIRRIANLYRDLSGRDFTFTTREGCDARYTSEGMDFAFSVITELKLQEIFLPLKMSTCGENNFRRDQLINRIGDLWKNDQKRSRTTKQSA